MALGIEADVISANDVSDKYKFIIAPMFFMLTEKASDLLVKYVENGGSLLGTYMTGYVNENCLCFEGGFPGRDLGNLFGVKSEEIDTLYPNDKNGIRFIPDNEREMILGVKDYAELLRTDDVRVLGTYTDDFYKDYQAITVKKADKGKAYYQAARCDDASLLKIMEFIVTSETVEEVKETLEFLISQYGSFDGPLVYPIIVKETNNNIGYVQLVPIDDGKWEIGCHIAKEYTGNGYATEALKAFLPVISEEAGLSEIYGICLKENEASEAVMRKCGFDNIFIGTGNYQGADREIVRNVWKRTA